MSLYPLTGAQALEEALQLVLGAILRKAHVVGPHGQREEVTAFGKIVTRLAELATIAVGGKELGPGAWESVKLLLGGG